LNDGEIDMLPIPQPRNAEPDTRREFLKHFLNGTAIATVLMVFGPGAMALSDPTRRAKNTAKHQFLPMS